MLSAKKGGTSDTRGTQNRAVTKEVDEVGTDVARQHLGAVECVRHAGVPVQGRQKSGEAWAVLSAQFHGRGQEFNDVH